jgi:DNA-binding GntR family transcriptional regulator
MASYMPDSELEERRSLLQAAARGSIPAQLKLEQEYHVRVYSASERKKYAVTIQLDNLPSSIRKDIDRFIEQTSSNREY